MNTLFYHEEICLKSTHWKGSGWNQQNGTAQFGLIRLENGVVNNNFLPLDWAEKTSVESCEEIESTNSFLAILVRRWFIEVHISETSIFSPAREPVQFSRVIHKGAKQKQPITIYNSLLRSLGNVPEQGFRQDFTDNKLHTSTGSPSPFHPRTLHSLQYPESFLHVNISPFIFPISPSLRVHLSYPQSNSCERFCDLSYLQTFDSIPVQYFPSRRLRERYHLVYCCFIRTSDIALSDILR